MKYRPGDLSHVDELVILQISPELVSRFRVSEDERLKLLLRRHSVQIEQLAMIQLRLQFREILRLRETDHQQARCDQQRASQHPPQLAPAFPWHRHCESAQAGRRNLLPTLCYRHRLTCLGRLCAAAAF